MNGEGRLNPLPTENPGCRDIRIAVRADVTLATDDQMIVETTPEGLLLRPAVTLPIEIYSEARLKEFVEAEADLEKALTRRRKRRR